MVVLCQAFQHIEIHIHGVDLCIVGKQLLFHNQIGVSHTDQHPKGLVVIFLDLQIERGGGGEKLA